MSNSGVAEKPRMRLDEVAAFLRRQGREFRLTLALPGLTGSAHVFAARMPNGIVIESPVQGDLVVPPGDCLLIGADGSGLQVVSEDFLSAIAQIAQG